MGTKARIVSTSLKVYHYHLISNFCLFSIVPEMIQGLHQIGARKPPLGIVKAASLIMHSSLLSIHFNDTQSSFLVPMTFFFHSTLFLYHPFILFVAFLLTSHLSPQILLFSSPTGLPRLSPCVKTTTTHSSTQPATSSLHLLT